MTAPGDSGGAQGTLSRLLRPRTIAVFGGRAAAEVVRQSDRMGFRGEIWPVHPRHQSVEGRRAFRSVAALPSAPDAAFLAINRHLTVEVVSALAERGAGGAVAYASGFAETPKDGAALQNELIAAAQAMPFLGPNCYGFINYFDGALLWPDQHGGRTVERGVAIVTQSGNIGLNLTMQKRALPIGYLVTLGNQAVVGPSRMIEALLDDPRVTAIGLHIEGIDDPVAFVRAAERAHKQGIPLVALKAGSTEAGARLTVSHTASIAGAEAVVDAFFDRLGVVRVRSIPVLLEALKVLHLKGPLSGRDIASMSCSGGEAALIADAMAGRTIVFRPLRPVEASVVAATLPALVTVSNPLDYHTFHWGNAVALTEAFAAMMAAGYDMTLLVLDFPRLDRCSDKDWEACVSAIVAASKRTGKMAAVVATLPEAMPEERALALAKAGVVPLFGIDEALSALEAAARAGEYARRIWSAPTFFTSQAAGKGRTLSEWQGKQALKSFGVNIPEGFLVEAAETAATMAPKLGFPVVVKAVGDEIAHKSEAGAVILDLRNAEAVRVASLDLLKIAKAILVETMVGDAVAELIVGVARDAQLGLHLVIGSGGVLVELVGDSQTLLMPATSQDVTEALQHLKVAKLLQGYRGKPAGDIKAVIEAIMAIQAFASENASNLLELDVNPLMVRPTGCGAVAADVLIRVAGEAIHG